MKKLLTLLLGVFCSLSLIGCQNMRQQDVGVVTGAVAGGLLGSMVGQGSGQVLAIGVGSIAGALIGGSIGKSMDETDRLKVNRTLENNPTGKPAYWHNASTGANYEVVPTRNVTVDGNQYCREYRTVAHIAGKKQQIYGTACRQPDGSWKAVSDN